MDVIILAAGSSNRMGKIREPNKVYMNILGHPAIMYPIFSFKQSVNKCRILVVYNKDNYDYVRELFDRYRFDVKLIEGGSQRQESVYKALKFVKSEKVLIHDGARVCVDVEIIQNVLDGLENSNAVIPVIKATNTLKQVKNGIVEKTINREEIYEVQTPQGFKTELLIKAYELIKKNKVNITDDASAMEYYEKEVSIVEGKRENIKLTTKIDYMLAKAIIYKRLNESKTNNFLDNMRR